MTLTADLPRELRVEVRDLVVGRRELFAREHEVLKGVDLELRGGEIVALVGVSGSGKTTLVEALAGLLPVAGGRVSWANRSPDSLRGRIGVAFQFPERSFFSETVLDDVRYGPLNLGLDSSAATAVARRALMVMGLDPDREGCCSPFELSAGRARRAALAAVWALRPWGYLLDEPTAGLDEEGCRAVAAMIKSEAARGCAVLVVGHDAAHFLSWTHNWMLLEDGRITRHGDPRTWKLKNGERAWPLPKK